MIIIGNEAMLIDKIYIRIKVVIAFIVTPFISINSKRYIFISMGGNCMGGNPHAFLKYVRTVEPGARLFFACKKIGVADSDDFELLKLYTFKYYLFLFSAKYIIADCRLSFPLFPYKRKGQLYVQTWHGTALKRIEKAASSLSGKYAKNAKRDSSMIDIFVSNGPFMTNIFQRDFWYEGPVYELGTPRNDIFFSLDSGNIKKKVYAKLGILETKRIVLYAPTFRNAVDSFLMYDINADSLLAKLSEKFGQEYVFVTRLHPYLLSKAGNLRVKELFPNAIEASAYENIQELLIAADVLITDYSSCMFDFMLTYKTCFLYAKDIETYDRGFYFDINKLPFPIAGNNVQLLKNIDNFDTFSYQKRLKESNLFFNAYEKGRASFLLFEKIK